MQDKNVSNTSYYSRFLQKYRSCTKPFFPFRINQIIYIHTKMEKTIYIIVQPQKITPSVPICGTLSLLVCPKKKCHIHIIRNNLTLKFPFYVIQGPKVCFRPHFKSLPLFLKFYVKSKVPNKLGQREHHVFSDQ